MMTTDVYRQLKAYQAGKPLPCGEKKRFHLGEDKDVLILAFVRMGGESRPWGIAFGHPNSAPKLLAVAEARDRDSVSEMAAKFAPTLLNHFCHQDFTKKPVSCLDDLAPIRQLWLPNESHLEMLHHLAFAYTWTMHGGENRKNLNALGRLCGWLFRESQRPGQMTVLTGAACLRESYTFPCEMIRQSHLGYLLAWLQSRGSYEKRLAEASNAELQSISTSLAPELERERLAELVDRYRDQVKTRSQNGIKVSKDIQSIISDQVKYRWLLMQDALEVLRNDKRKANAGIATLVQESLNEQWYQYHRIEQKKDDQNDGPAYVPATETDRHPAAAASRYLVHQASSELFTSLLIHDDREILWEAIVAGDAFEGKIVKVRDEGVGRKRIPVWTVHDSSMHQLRLSVGSVIAVVGHRDRKGKIRGIEALADGYQIEIEITTGKTDRIAGNGVHGYEPISQKLVGKTIAFTNHTISEISRNKSMIVWNSRGPGAWLTHRSPTTSTAVIAEDDIDDGPIVEEFFEKQ